MFLVHEICKNWGYVYLRYLSYRFLGLHTHDIVRTCRVEVLEGALYCHRSQQHGGQKITFHSSILIFTYILMYCSTNTRSVAFIAVFLVQMEDVHLYVWSLGFPLYYYGSLNNHKATKVWCYTPTLKDSNRQCKVIQKTKMKALGLNNKRPGSTVI